MQKSQYKPLCASARERYNQVVSLQSVLWKGVSFFVHRIYLYDIQNVIQTWKDGPRAWGLLWRQLCSLSPWLAQGGALWEDECMTTVVIYSPHWSFCSTYVSMSLPLCWVNKEKILHLTSTSPRIWLLPPFPAPSGTILIRVFLQLIPPWDLSTAIPVFMERTLLSFLHGISPIII